jgi:hypothetical protein
VLQLNRPKARNAISTHLLDTLSKHVDAIAAEGGRTCPEPGAGICWVLMMSSSVLVL